MALPLSAHLLDVEGVAHTSSYDCRSWLVHLALELACMRWIVRLALELACMRWIVRLALELACMRWIVRLACSPCIGVGQFKIEELTFLCVSKKDVSERVR